MENRRKVLKSSWRQTGAISHPDPKIGYLPWESANEEAVLLLFCCCADVVGLETQAHWISLSEINPKERYAGDVIATVRDEICEKRYLLEIKPFKYFDKKNLEDRFILVEERAVAAGYDGFAVLFSEDLRRKPFISNASQLKPYLAEPAVPEYFDRVCKLIESGPKSVSALLSISPSPQTHAALLGYIGRNELTFDWSQSLSNTLLIGLPGKPFPKRSFFDVANIRWRCRLLELRALAHRQAYSVGDSAYRLGGEALPQCFG